MTTLTVDQLAQRVEGRLEGGRPDAILSGVAGIREAEAGQLAFVGNQKYAAAAAATKATAVIVDETWTRPCPATLIRVKDPEKAFASAAAFFAPPEVRLAPGIHPTAVIAPDVQLGANVYVGPQCVLEPGVKVGDRTVLVAQIYLGHGVSVGADTRVYPQVSIREYCRIGDRVILHNGTVIGSDGFGYTIGPRGLVKVPQLGIVVVGNDVELGANVCIDRARFGQTRIGNGVKIDNLVQVAHNVLIGDHSVLTAQVGISGSARIGSRTLLYGQAGVAGHLEIGDDVVIGPQSGISKDVPSKSHVIGGPAVSPREFAESVANVARLPKLKARVAELEKRLAELEKRAEV